MQCLFTRFDARHSAISDRRTNFQSVFKRVSHFIGTSNRLIIAYHPHTSDQEELKNRYLKWICEKLIDQSLMDLSIKNDELLWVYRNTCKTSIDTSHCQIFYGKAFHLYFMLENKALWAVKLHNMDASLVALERKYILLELEEYRFHAFESALLYKEKGNDAKVLVKFMP